jgi:hypothetical protein
MELPPHISKTGLAKFLVMKREVKLKLNMENWQKFKAYVLSQISPAVCVENP